MADFVIRSWCPPLDHKKMHTCFPRDYATSVKGLHKQKESGGESILHWVEKRQRDWRSPKASPARDLSPLAPASWTAAVPCRFGFQGQDLSTTHNPGMSSVFE